MYRIKLVLMGQKNRNERGPGELFNDSIDMIVDTSEVETCYFEENHLFIQMKNCPYDYMIN